MTVRISRQRELRRACVLLAGMTVSLVGSVALAASASAHASLISSTPADGASIAALPTDVSFTFGEEVSTPAFVAVTAPDGTDISAGDPDLDGAIVTQAIEPVGERGIYSMSFRVASADGHPITDTLTFTVTTGKPVHQVSAPDGTSSTAATTSDGEDVFGTHRTEAFLAIAVVIIGLAVLLASNWLARSRDGSP